MRKYNIPADRYGILFFACYTVVAADLHFLQCSGCFFNSQLQDKNSCRLLEI